MSEPIRVLHILQRMEAAGTQTLLMNLYRSINRKKVQFDFLVEYQEKQFYDDEIEQLGGRIYRTSFREDLNIFRFMRYLDRFFAEHKEYKVVHLHAYTIGWFCLRAEKKHGVPVRIVHSHENGIAHDTKMLIKLIMQKLYVINATDFFACSTEAGNYLFKNKKFLILKNAIDSQKFIANLDVGDEFRKEINAENRLIIGHVGRFTKSKNHSFLLDIFAEVKKIRSDALLLLVGSGDLENEIRQKIHKLSLDDSVILLGNRKDMERVYKAMNVFVLPSLFEGLGIVAIEAQAAGIPCICSEEVSKEANVSPLFRSMPLEEEPRAWAEAVVAFSNHEMNHTNTNKYIIQNGYDISETALHMQEYYLKKFKSVINETEHI